MIKYNRYNNNEKKKLENPLWHTRITEITTTTTKIHEWKHELTIKCSESVVPKSL